MISGLLLGGSNETTKFHCGSLTRVLSVYTKGIVFLSHASAMPRTVLTLYCNLIEVKAKRSYFLRRDLENAPKYANCCVTRGNLFSSMQHSAWGRDQPRPSRALSGANFHRRGHIHFIAQLLHQIAPRQFQRRDAVCR